MFPRGRQCSVDLALGSNPEHTICVFNDINELLHPYYLYFEFVYELWNRTEKIEKTINLDKVRQTLKNFYCFQNKVAADDELLNRIGHLQQQQQQLQLRPFWKTFERRKKIRIWIFIKSNWVAIILIKTWIKDFILG